MTSQLKDSQVGWVLPRQPRLPFEAAGYGVTNSIATVTVPQVHPAWDECFNGLLDELTVASAGNRDPLEPSCDAICSALSWLNFLRREQPQAAPTFIAPDPDGGILIERRVLAGQNTYIWELVLSNDGRATMTLFLNGEVIDSQETARKPR